MSRETFASSVCCIVVAMNLVMRVSRSQSEEDPPLEQAAQRERVTKEFSRSFRYLAEHEGEERNDPWMSGIGGLAQSDVYRRKLALAESQAVALINLDGLVWRARLKSYIPAADYMDTNPPDYGDYIEQAIARRQGSIDHASAMVLTGLLTEPQAAVVTQDTLAPRQYWLNQLRYSSYIQDLVGLSHEQIQALNAVGKQGREQRLRLNWFPVSSTAEDRKAFDDRIAEIAKSEDREVARILTKEQFETLNQLVAGPTEALKRPDLRRPSDDEMPATKIAELSPLFRALANKAEGLKISRDQQQLLSQLEELIRDGVFWIDRRPPAAAAIAKSKFVEHAEQVVLQGILTAEQARQILESSAANDRSAGAETGKHGRSAAGVRLNTGSRIHRRWSAVDASASVAVLTLAHWQPQPEPQPVATGTWHWMVLGTILQTCTWICFCTV